MTLTLASAAPDFALEAVRSGTPQTIKLSDCRGRWVVLFFYPADFSFICPTEITGFQAGLNDFRKASADVLAISTDDLESHRQWAKELGGIEFPLLSDPGGKVAAAYGVLDPKEGRAFRATFILNPEGTVAYSVASPANVGRSVAETLRVLQALQTGRLCPVDWKPGEPTLDPENEGRR